MAKPAQANYLTLGQIADRLNLPLHRVRYAVNQYRIAPYMRVGILRVWSENSMPEIERVIEQIASNRDRGGRL